MSQPKPKPDFHYNTPIFGWVFMSLWLLVLFAFTYIFMRDHGFDQFDYPLEVGVMLLFWVFGLGGGSQVFAMPVTRIWIGNGEVEVFERWPLRQSLARYSLDQIEPPVIRKHYDSEGDSHECQFRLPGGKVITFGTFNDRDDAEKRLAEFLEKIRMAR